MATSVRREGREFQVEDADGQRHTVRMVRTRNDFVGPDWMFMIGLTELTPRDEDQAVFTDADGGTYFRLTDFPKGPEPGR